MSAVWTRSSGTVGVGRQVVAARAEIGQEGVPDGRPGLGRLDRGPGGRPGWLRPDRGRVARAEHRLDLAEPGRLEAGRRIEPIAERQELERGHRLEDVDLRDQRLEDLQDPVQQVQRRVGVAGVRARSTAVSS